MLFQLFLLIGSSKTSSGSSNSFGVTVFQRQSVTARDYCWRNYPEEEKC